MLIRTDDKTLPDNEEQGLPLPTQMVSNGEFLPIPQTPKQKKIERLVRTMADERARRLGLSRRDFLRSAAGTATALMAINIANGCGDDGESGGFQIPPEATCDPEAGREAFARDFFIVDVQTHHADLDGPVGTNPLLQDFFRGFRSCLGNPPNCTRGDIQELSQLNYLKEVLVDSDTAVAMMSGLPAPSAGLAIINNDGMAATRDLGNDLGASQRMMTQAMITPNFAPSSDTGTLVSDLERLVADLGISAIKTYPGAGRDPNDPSTAIWPAPGWWLDDEEVSYPMLAEAERLGIHIVNIHKGLRLGIFDGEHIKPRDIPKAARDWPQMNFCIYHSAGEFLDDLVALKRDEIPSSNVYAELGSIFAFAVTAGDAVDRIGHLLGKLITAFGVDHVLWGTDSIWYGTPQWQIDALKTYRMPQRLIDEFGYPQITDEIRAKIFGLNAARLYGIDVGAVRCSLPDDPLARMRSELRQFAHRDSLRTYGPKTRREFLQMNYGGRDPFV
jgi:predicted TIM-barrel fold metal-dependent hydrolase